jgi:amidase
MAADRADFPLMTASALAAELRSGALSARAVLDAHLERIAGHDPALAAFVTLDEAGARDQAARLDALPAQARGALHGLPVAVKDLVDTAGVRTTYGSALFAGHVPDTDDLVVARLRKAGAIIIGKTNTPEFGFGAICRNQLCGPTRNPFDPALTSGGSSGGSAVAVATGMVPLAHGTDFGGSVRTPASFCGSVAIRPTPGRIAAPGRKLAWDRLATHGVMARNVDDCALMLAALSGPHGDDPTSVTPEPRPVTQRPRLAATVDFGVAPVALAVRERFSEALDHLGRAVGQPAVASPHCQGAPAAFKTLRAAHVRHAFTPAADRVGDRLTPTVAWNVAEGEDITAQDYLEAESMRAQLYRGFAAFFREYDLLIRPAASVLPWPNDIPDVLAIDGIALPSIIDYLAVTFIVSLVGFPALATPRRKEIIACRSDFRSWHGRARKRCWCRSAARWNPGDFATGSRSDGALRTTTNSPPDEFAK